jgi:serine/threonine protein kinase/WD40 repeat protein
VEQLDNGDPREVGPYQIVGRIGRGGMGQVYLGRSAGGKPVAVKVIRPAYAADPEYRQRFRHEVEAAQQVGGFYTALVVAADPDANAPWMATLYIDGPPLADTVKHRGPLGPAQVCDLGAALAEGLVAIHKCGLVHRDLKPANILMASDGPRIIDFGVAKASGKTRLTQADVVIGTPEYMSPEQVDDGDVGPQSDVFAFGSVLVYAATGCSPFHAASNAAIFNAILNKNPGLSSLSSPLRAILVECLAKDPARRPTPASLVTALESLSGAFPDSSAPGLAPDSPQGHEVATVTPTPFPPRTPSAGDKASASPLPVRRRRLSRPRPPAPTRPPLQVRPAADSWWDLAADPAGRWIAASDGDGTIALWDPASALPLRSWLAGAPVRALAASVGNWVGTSAEDQSVQIWDVETGTACASVTLHRPVSALALDWSAGLLAAASADERVLRVWDVADPGEPVLFTEFPCGASPTAVAFGDAGGLAAAGCADGGLRVWDLTRARQGEPADAEQVQSGPVLAVTWDPAAGRWLSASAGELGRSRAVAVSAAGHGALIDGNAGRVHVFPLDAPARLRPMAGGTSTLAGAVFAGPGKLVTGSADGAAYLWDARRNVLRSTAAPRRVISAIAAAPAGPGAARVAVCDNLARLTVYDVAGGALAERWQQGTGRPATAVTFSPDGGTVVTADDAVRTWKASTGAPLSSLSDSAVPTRAVAYDRAGKHLAAAGADGVVRVWRAGKPSHTLLGHKSYVYAVEFGADGRLISAGRDQTIRIWDLASGGNPGGPVSVSDVDFPVRVLAAHPADESVAVGCADGTVRLCRPPRWEDAVVLVGHVHGITSACFDGTGRYLLTASMDGTARVWDLPAGTVQLVLAPEPDGWAAAVDHGDGEHLGYGPAAEFIWQARGLARHPLVRPSEEATCG